MGLKMDEVEEKACVFEESFEIDFDYEFDVAKFFDFAQLETPEEIAESELWFDIAQGHPPSPLIVKLDMEADDFTDSFSSSPRCGTLSVCSIDNDSGGSEVSLIDKGEKGPQVLKLKSTSQPNYQVISRLLQPTASLLAKKNQYIDVHSTRNSRRLQKLGNPIKSPGETDATKRQKLEIGYLRKVAQLKHQTSFSHKSSKKAETTVVNSTNTKPKVTVPKEPDLATTHRALRQRSKNTPQLENDVKYNSSTLRARPSDKKILESQSFKNKSTPSLPQIQESNVRGGKVTNGSAMLDYKRINSSKSLVRQKSDVLDNFRAHPLNKKISSKGDIGVFRNCKKENTVPKEFKLSSSKKLSQNPPTELFSKLSLIPGNHSSSLLEEDPLQVKVLKKNVSLPNMKENKNANAVIGKSMSCFGNGRRMITDIKNHLSNSRSFTIS
ncbi:protein TPX2-like [Chenopodium quinoa]|uniref:protein TPX2-like n=1 Tax=Chenopodium quinoa TaxID=63459 RepID=UPI000B7946B5|nr:protein TPX2-like [Chenopodium quinoa]